MSPASRVAPQTVLFLVLGLSLLIVAYESFPERHAEILSGALTDAAFVVIGVGLLNVVW